LIESHYSDSTSWTLHSKRGALVDCLKTNEDKSSDNRVHTSDARMIKTIDAVSRRGVRSLRLKHHCSAKTQGSRPASQHHCTTKMQGSTPAFQHYSSAQTRSSRPVSSILKPAFQLQVSLASQL